MAASTTVRTADELARRVVRKIAPEELSSFDIVAAPYLESPKQAERRLRQAPTTRWASAWATSSRWRPR